MIEKKQKCDILKKYYSFAFLLFLVYLITSQRKIERGLRRSCEIVAKQKISLSAVTADRLRMLKGGYKMDKIPFCFPVFYLGLVEERANVCNQKDAMNILFNGGCEVDSSWDIQKEAANKYIQGGEGVPKYRIKQVLMLSETELEKRVRLLNIEDIETCVSAFHAFLCERVEISEEKIRKLETIMQQTADPVLYIATAFRESLYVTGPTKKYLPEEVKKELIDLHKTFDASLRKNKLKIEPQDRTWGDNSSDKRGYSQRRTYTTAEITSGILGSRTATFNSIFDETIDERKFVSVCESSELGGGQHVRWKNDSIEVRDGEIYTIRIYVHNDNLNGYRSVAEKTKVKYVLPADTEISNEQEIRGYISSPNAVPSEYWSSVILKSDTNVFSLRYVKGSFVMHNAVTGSRGCQLEGFRNDSYTKIGYKYLDGEYPGGSQYASYISIQARVVFEAQCRVKTKQRIQGSPDGWWYKTTEAEVGDLVECQIFYRNTSNTLQKNLMVRYVLPNNMEYIPGSTVLYNSNYQTGVKLIDDTVTTSGINIGDYKPQGNAYVRFIVRVIDKNLASGLNCLINWGAVTVEGKVAKDNAQLYVAKE